ncbi:MAG: hypothetical protein HY959_00225 [Ignavibacteriae bacterium]|nr:hypothetical protein [Ignavibacteriota bacterium]
MRKTKFAAVLLIFAMVLLSGAVYSQDEKTESGKYKNTPEEQAKIITDKLNKHLDLTPEQYDKVKKLYTDNIKYKRELKDKDLISKSEVKSKQKEFREGIKSTLTDKQKDKMKKMMKKKHGMKKKKHPRR